MEVRRRPTPKLAQFKRAGFAYMLVQLICLLVISISLFHELWETALLDSAEICDLGKALSLSLASVSWFVDAILYLDVCR